MMSRYNWSQSNGGQRALAIGLAALLVATAFASAAAAAPSMYYRGATVSADSAVVGESVTVTATVENVGGDGGGFSFVFERNGSEFADTRITVPANSRRSVNETVRFNSPGTHEITVNDEVAGYVEVRPTDLRVERETAEERVLDVRARGVSTATAQRYDVPAATNRSFTLQQWSVRGASGTYNQTLTEYATPAEAGVELPASDQADLVGVVTVDSDTIIESTTTRFRVDRSALRAAGLDDEAVTVYQRNGTRWERIETEIVDADGERVIYEASGTSAVAYAVGDIATGVSVADSTLETDATDGGQRITLEATLQTDGPLDTTYDALMLVDGAQVNSTTVTVPGDGERTVRLSHEVAEPDSYQIALNDQSVGTVVITAGQVEDPATSTSTDGGVDTGLLDDVSVPVPATVFGVDTLYVGAGAGVVLVLLLGIVLLARRGGGNDQPSSFDDL